MELAKDSPSTQLLLNFDFRVESLQQLVAGELMPGERRVKIVQQRRQTIQEEVLNGSTPSDGGAESDFRQAAQETAPNTSERASATGTASLSDIEQLGPKVGANRPDTAEPAESTSEGSETTSFGPPSMSDAGAGRS